MVYVVHDNSVVERAVTPGLKIGDLTAVSGDLKSGEKAVLRPGPELREGSPVGTAAK